MFPDFSEFPLNISTCFTLLLTDVLTHGSVFAVLTKTRLHPQGKVAPLVSVTDIKGLPKNHMGTEN